MDYSYNTKMVCSQQINFHIEGNVITNVSFIGGCNGNLKGISRLLKGMKAEDVISRLEGVNCNGRGTSCPDQLAKALKEAIKQAM